MASAPVEAVTGGAQTKLFLGDKHIRRHLSPSLVLADLLQRGITDGTARKRGHSAQAQVAVELSDLFLQSLAFQDEYADASAARKFGVTGEKDTILGTG
jgi:hypothetical protein